LCSGSTTITRCVPEDRRVCGAGEDRLAAVCGRDAVPEHAAAQAPRGEGRILTRNWELYDAQHVVFQPKHMSVDELQRGIESAWKHAYSYSSIWKRIRSSPAPWPVRLGTNIGYRFYANNLSRFYNCDWIIGRVPRNQPVVDESAVAEIAS
jgi:hypothetical protein